MRYNGQADPKLQTEAAEQRRIFAQAQRDDDDSDGIQQRKTAQLLSREFYLEADNKWRDSDGAELTCEQGVYRITEPDPSWALDRMSSWRGVQIPDRLWFMPEWILRGQTTGLYGIPGVRKSLFVLQAMIAGALGEVFCGVRIEKCRTLGLFCEDEDNEVGRRAKRILEFYDRNFNAPEMENCFWQSLVGATATEFVNFSRAGTPRWSAEFRLFEEIILDVKPAFAALDTTPHFFGGNENARREVHTFIRKLDNIGKRGQTAMLLSMHPSVRGIATGLLVSGSTGWEGGMRARIGLYDPTQSQNGDDENDNTPVVQPFSNTRNLIRFKSNYAENGVEIPLEIINGSAFQATGSAQQSQFSGQMRQLAVNAKFFELFDSVTKATGPRSLCASPSSPRYLPKVFNDHPERGNFTRREFTAALKRLLYGKPQRLREVSDDTRNGRGEKYLVVSQSREQGEE